MGTSGLDEEEFRRWSATAREHLNAARITADGGANNWACVAAEQAAQAAVKAVLHLVGAGDRARGHDLIGLATTCDELIGGSLVEDHGAPLRRLYRHYQPARYPDALPGAATPHQTYTSADSQQSITDAEEIVVAMEHVRDALDPDMLEGNDAG